jgi:hypothetical protein
MQRGKLVATPLGKSMLNDARQGGLPAMLFRLAFWHMDLAYFGRGTLNGSTKINKASRTVLGLIIHPRQTGCWSGYLRSCRWVCRRVGIRHAAEQRNRSARAGEGGPGWVPPSREKGARGFPGIAQSILMPRWRGRRSAPAPAVENEPIAKFLIGALAATRLLA